MTGIHELIKVYGPERARELVDPARRSVLEIAIKYLAEDREGFAYSHPGFAMTNLPHKRTEPAEVFEKRVSSMTLTIEPLLVDGARRGVPYGSRARLILIYLQTEAVKTRSRTVELGASMRNWLCRMGIPTGGKNYKDVMEQARRIEGSIVSFTWHGDDGTARWRDTIVRGRFEPLSDEADPRQGRLFVDTVELSETFYEALLRHPAPIHEAALRHIANKSAVIDVYLWLAYRLHVLEQPVNLSWSALQAQFGSNYQRLSGFKPRFVEILEQALAVYPQAQVRIGDGGVLLYPSAPPVRPRLAA
ncbi:MAG: replication protein RepA [Alphaproteobacteria bacterium]